MVLQSEKVLTWSDVITSSHNSSMISVFMLAKPWSKFLHNTVSYRDLMNYWACSFIFVLIFSKNLDFRHRLLHTENFFHKKLCHQNLISDQNYTTNLIRQKNCNSSFLVNGLCTFHKAIHGNGKWRDSEKPVYFIMTQRHNVLSYRLEFRTRIHLFL
jgi:hypothetical protein